MSAGVPGRYCGRDFLPAELEQIRELLRRQPALNRVQLSRRICQDLGWLNPAGQLKEMSCRVALLRMESAGLIQLPKPLGRNGNGRTRPALTAVSEAQVPWYAPLALLEPLRFQNVKTEVDSRLWNELIQRYHYLGYSPLSGAQLRYLVWSGNGRVLAALGFGASAWHTQPRDQYIGWSDEQRRKNLHLIVNNARFLILPWIHSACLASRILAGILPSLLADWSRRYSYRPVLLETFVESPRFVGTAYQAANWICVGQTKGRSKLEKQNRRVCPLKNIWLYPLHPGFRRLLQT